MVVDALVGGSVGFVVVVVVVEVMISCGLTVFALGFSFSLLLSSVSLLLNFTVLFESVETPIEYFLGTEIPKSFFDPVNFVERQTSNGRAEKLLSL